MAFVGSNIASTSGAGSSGGPLASTWVSLTFEEQLTNFKRIFIEHYYNVDFDDLSFEFVASAVKELRIDPFVDIKRFNFRGWDYGQFLVGTTPLHWAVLMDDRTMVRFILTSGKVDINASTRKCGDTALHYAIVGGNNGVVEDLLEYKVDVGICNYKRKSAFYYMVKQKDSMFGILKRILANNVNICDDSKSTALHHAVRKKAIDVVTYLLDKQANVNLHNERRYTPLHYAAEKGSLDVATCLLQCNADVNALDKCGRSPLHYAAKKGSLDVATCLLQQKADVNVLDEDKWSPLHYATMEGSLDVVTCLLQHNADVNALDNNGWSPLFFSIFFKKVNTSTTLMAAAADVHFKDKQKNNALHLAMQGYPRYSNMVNIVKFFREHDVDINALNSKGYSSFFVAVAEGHTEVVKELLKSKEKIKLMEECNGQTAIQFAFDNNHEHIKRILLECDDVSRYVGDLYRDRQVYVDAANAILVGAALIASITFASWLQPPLGYTTAYPDLTPSNSDMNYVDVQHNASLRAFWIFNTLSFYFAIGTVVFGARSVLPRRQMFIKTIVVKLHHNLLVTSILLACSVFFVIIAFGIAGCIVLTPTLRFQWYMIVPTIIGGLVCLVSLGFLFKSIMEDNIEKGREALDLF